ncbi:hypothetical protein Leryth_024186 [Lithospermum erythrorhizon]|nr:hypothetical protein Leryth_024186 [Lithospermum erythrorhizon]
MEASLVLLMARQTRHSLKIPSVHKHPKNSNIILVFVIDLSVLLLLIFAIIC